MASPVIANKRHNSILSQKKSKAQRQLGYIKQLPDISEPIVPSDISKNNTFTPAINFPDSNLVIKDNEKV